jgi:hypothetical protein
VSRKYLWAIVFFQFVADCVYLILKDLIAVDVGPIIIAISIGRHACLSAYAPMLVGLTFAGVGVIW